MQDTQLIIQVPALIAFKIAFILGCSIAALGLLSAVAIIIAAIIIDRAEADFDHDNMEDLNDEIEIRDNFNLAVKTKPTDENKTQNR